MITEDILSNALIFKSNFVDKIKNLDIVKVYKKSWLVLQVYNDKKKDLVLT